MTSKLRIGDVAELFDVTTKTLRHYEELGLLQPDREENGYRLYGPEDVLHLQRIRQLQSLGLSLKEVSRLLEHDDQALWERVLHSLREEATREIDLLQERLDRIGQLLEEGLPPNEESLPAPPDKVNEYLEQHLPEGARENWQRGARIYASLQATMGPGIDSTPDAMAPYDANWLPLQPLLLPLAAGPAYRGFATTLGNGLPLRNGHKQGEWAILRVLNKSERLIKSKEDEGR